MDNEASYLPARSVRMSLQVLSKLFVPVFDRLQKKKKRKENSLPGPACDAGV